MTTEANSELTGDEPERSVIQRVAQALEDKETGEAATIVLDKAGASSTPLPARRGS